MKQPVCGHNEMQGSKHLLHRYILMMLYCAFNSNTSDGYKINKSLDTLQLISRLTSLMLQEKYLSCNSAC